jgi:protein-S-isoprenylcysteine O-methyltransferase Ste14
VARGLGLRLVVMLLIAAMLRSTSLRQFLSETQRFASHSRVLGWTGVALYVLGFGLAIVARWRRGRNWGMPMSHKEQPELVTSGPYAHLRHPIYTGLILAMLGSAIGVNVFWAVLLVPVGAEAVGLAALQCHLLSHRRVPWSSDPAVYRL